MALSDTPTHTEQGKERNPNAALQILNGQRRCLYRILSSSKILTFRGHHYGSCDGRGLQQQQWEEETLLLHLIHASLLCKYLEDHLQQADDGGKVWKAALAGVSAVGYIVELQQCEFI
jgi:hypothetical protein